MRRLRQVVDLYVNGTVKVLRGGSKVWVQALNPFEQDTARSEAQVAKARITLALKEFGSDENAKVRMYFLEDGLEAARTKCVEARIAEAMPKVLDRLRIDEEWTERLDILDRGLLDTARPPTSEERQLLEKVANDYTREVTTRLADERSFIELELSEADEETLWEVYLEWYLDRRAAELTVHEFRLHQLLYGVRVCDAVDHGEHTWTHESCNHDERFFLTKEEVRSMPEELLEELMNAVDEVDMTVREAKNSDRQGSSSDSSPLPSGPAESTPSTPSATPHELPGT